MIRLNLASDALQRPVWPDSFSPFKYFTCLSTGAIIDVWAVQTCGRVARSNLVLNLNCEVEVWEAQKKGLKHEFRHGWGEATKKQKSQIDPDPRCRLHWSRLEEWSHAAIQERRRLALRKVSNSEWKNRKDIVAVEMQICPVNSTRTIAEAARNRFEFCDVKSSHLREKSKVNHRIQQQSSAAVDKNYWDATGLLNRVNRRATSRVSFVLSWRALKAQKARWTFAS